jgi:hypothetical protein
MILQQRPDGLLLIRQTDHAALSGEFARHWGNDHFEPLRPRHSMLIAAEHHDDGWQSWDASPRVDPRTGRPYQFTDMPTGEHLAFYRQGIDSVLRRDPYAGLLVSMHLSGLYQRRFGTDRASSSAAMHDRDDADLRQALDQLSDQQRELREQLKAVVEPHALQEGPLWANYKLLQVFDRLSLYFCTAPPREARIGPAPVNARGREVELVLHPLDGETVQIAPYPFDQSALAVEARVVVLADRAYESDAALHAALGQAVPTTLHFTVKAG